MIENETSKQKIEEKKDHKLISSYEIKNDKTEDIEKELELYIKLHIANHRPG